MEKFLSNIEIRVNPSIYLKDPGSSDLGNRMIKGSIGLIFEIGFESFTFRKLAKAISSTEASVYRYFESKHKLLLYLTSWYWSWLEYRLLFLITNVENPIIQLERAIILVSKQIEEDGNFEHINEIKLHQIVISESSKVYLTREVDEDNKLGSFSGYKQLVERISSIILEIKPNYKYPHMLVSTVIEGIHHQRYFAEHLPRLTDRIAGEDAITAFYKSMVLDTLKIEPSGKYS
ncbi:MAG: TetR/AcrR family transcriptional regulator [Crocinitomicaceae bacterium]|nr:TetR/AcrR family transcriptional regulator [Flavobacteriales bacterium]NQZ34122.1 TetR/AcrR family transcriptional regulator [Crocinitomicaceae bacterium]